MNSKKSSSHAIYLPALSLEFARLGHTRKLKRRFSFSEADLNFLNPASKLFFYPYALYSAGQAAKSDTAALEQSIVSQRDRSQTTVIGDSGGFQIQGGQIKFSGDATSRRMLHWLERNADFSMTLDFPTGGISLGNMSVHAARLQAQGHDLQAMCRRNGLSLDYNACLKQSLINLDYFAANRDPDKTEFLNVIQGRNEQESKVWYETVKDFPFTSWAFAGLHQSSFSMLLNRLIDMRDDGYLQKAKWIHILGMSRLSVAYLFNAVFREVRKINPDIQISFDTASPFRAAAGFQLCISYLIDKRGVQFKTVSMPDVGKGSDTRLLNTLCETLTTPFALTQPHDAPNIIVNPVPVHTAIGERVTVADICVGSNGSSDLDTDSVLILMNHNVQAYLQAFQDINEKYDKNPLQDQVPTQLRIARAMIEQTFEASDPKAFVRECGYHLDLLAGRYSGAMVGASPVASDIFAEL